MRAMEKIKIEEVIVVEGKYDVNTLKQVFDAIIVTTDGFGVFRDREKLELIRRMAQAKGVIILTDPDGAGFVIRNHLKSCLDPSLVKHAYIPDLYGKERRKTTRSKEGKLGVEGMRPDVLIRAMEKAGATMNGAPVEKTGGEITKADLFALGLSGRPNSAQRRQELLRKLDLPERLSPNALLDVLNALTDLETLQTLLQDN